MAHWGLSRKNNYKTTNWIRGTNYKRNLTEPAYVVWPCSENGRRKITQNNIEVDAETKESTRKTEKKNWSESIRKAVNERSINEGQWEVGRSGV